MTAPPQAPTPRVEHSRLGSLDGLRIVAALMVLLTHVSSSSGVENHGFLGVVFDRFDFAVPLFFVLSGFLLMRYWTKPWRQGADRPSLRRYWLHRLIRIYPAYWVFLAATYLLLPDRMPHSHLLTNVTLTQNYLGGLSLDMFHIWSLSMEVSFYAVLPLLTWLILRRGRRLALIVIGALVLAAPLWIILAPAWVITTSPVGSHLWTLRLWLPAHIDWFAGGMALAVLEPTIRSLADRAARPVWLRGGAWLLAALALGLLTLTPAYGDVGFGDKPTSALLLREVTYAAMSTLTLAALLQRNHRPGFWQRWLDSALMTHLAHLTYAFFLWHFVVIKLVRAALGLEPFAGGFLITLALTLPITLVLAELSWQLIEKPGQRFLRRWDNDHRRPVTPAVEPAGEPLDLGRADPADSPATARAHVPMSTRTHDRGGPRNAGD